MDSRYVPLYFLLALALILLERSQGHKTSYKNASLLHNWEADRVAFARFATAYVRESNELNCAAGRRKAGGYILAVKNVKIQSEVLTEMLVPIRVLFFSIWGTVIFKELHNIAVETWQSDIKV